MPLTKRVGMRGAASLMTALLVLGVGGGASGQQGAEEGPFDRLISELQESRVEQALNPNAAGKTGTSTPTKAGTSTPAKVAASQPKGNGTPGTGGAVKPGAATEALGVEILIRGGEPVVAAVRPESPAAKAGVIAGDRILIVAGKQGRGQSAEQVAGLLREGTKPEVSIAVARGEDVLLLKIARSVEAEGPQVVERPLGKPAGDLLSLVGFDAREWKLNATGRGQVTREDDDLVVKVPENAAGGAEGWSQLPVRGDFTLDFGHFLGDWEHQAGDTVSVEFRFGPMPGGEAPLVIRRRVDAAGKDTLEIVTPGQSKVANVSNSQLTLQLRRKGSRLLLSRLDLDSGDQVPIATFTQGLADSVYIGVAAQKTGAAALALNLYLSNGEPLELK